ncbi:MAG: hypothetical protein K8R17_08530 [Methanosarcinales archaeon]|nr:hypothetical protein [Methanosarcinales archaeon]
MQIVLSAICTKIPEDDRGEACELLEKASDEPYIEDRVNLINMVLSKISTQMSEAKKLDEVIISLTPGIREELVISVGAEFAGTGAKHEIHIPLQEITYHDIKKDLESIKGRGSFKIASLSAKLVAKVREYLIRNNKNELLKYLS